LTTRGWALQERVLSGRIVHFTEEGIVWECRTSIQSEDQRRLFPGHLQKWANISNIIGKNQLIPLRPNGYGNNAPALELYICSFPHIGTLILLPRG